jgi:hypothetical protein
MKDHEEEQQAFPNTFPVGSFHESFDGDIEELIDVDADAGFEEPVANGTVDTVNTTLQTKQKKKARPSSLEHKVKKKAIHSPTAKAKHDAVKNRPKRALSAYNLFFQTERKRMIKVGFSDMAVSDNIIVIV